MKELEAHNRREEKVEISVKKQQETEYVLEGNIKPQKGHTVWELNEETGDILPAQYKIDTVVFNAFTKKEPEKLIVNKDCVYIPALNPANAKKKYLQNTSQSHYYTKEPLLNINDLNFK